jgi:hypothetical protein
MVEANGRMLCTDSESGPVDNLILLPWVVSIPWATPAIAAVSADSRVEAAVPGAEVEAPGAAVGESASAAVGCAFAPFAGFVVDVSVPSAAARERERRMA